MEKCDIIATPPGATIKEQLIDKKISLQEFALQMNMSEESIERLIQGKTLLTADIASRLENVLGIPTDFWIKLEKIYRRKCHR